MAGETISQEQIDELNSYFEKRREDGQGYTNDAIAAATKVSVPTVIKYKKRWADRQKDEDALKEQAFQPDPVDLLDSTLKDLKVNEDKREFVVKSLRSNRTLMQNPAEVHTLLTEATGLKPFYVSHVMKVVFPNTPLPQSQYPGQQGQYGAPQQPGMYPQNPYAPQPPPGYYPQMPGGFPPPYYPGMYPPWMQPPQQNGITKDDLKTVLAEVLSAAQPQTEAAYEEYDEPVIVNGEVMVDGENNPIMRHVRKPVTTGEQSTIRGIAQLKEAGVLRVDNGNNRELERLYEEIRELRRQPQQPAAPAIPPEVQATLAALQQSSSRLEAQLEAEKARREEAEKWAPILRAQETELRHKEAEVAEARAKAASVLPAADQIVLKAVDKTDKVLDNFNKRQDRLMSVITPLFINPDKRSLPVQNTDSDLEQLVAQQAAIDAAETPPMPAASVILIPATPLSKPAEAPIPTPASTPVLKAPEPEPAPAVEEPAEHPQ